MTSMPVKGLSLGSVRRLQERLAGHTPGDGAPDEENAYAAGEVGFLARALVQATLPHSDPKADEFVLRNGHFTLSILAPKDVGLPYGRYPRLILAYLTTEAVRRKSPDVEPRRYSSERNSSTNRRGRRTRTRCQPS